MKRMFCFLSLVLGCSVFAQDTHDRVNPFDSLAAGKTDGAWFMKQPVSALRQAAFVKAATSVLDGPGASTNKGIAAACLLRAGKTEVIREAVRGGFGAETLAALSAIKDQRQLAPLANAIRTCLPGGSLSGALPTSAQVQAMSLYVRAATKDNLPAVFKKIARITDLTSVGEIRTGSVDAMKTLPPEKWPIGFERYAAGALDPAQMKLGREVYMRPTACVTCHQANGEGQVGVFPPIAGSDWLKGDPDRSIKIVLWGLIGEIEVEGTVYNSAMTPQASLLKNDEVAAVLTYVRNSWGLQEGPVTEEQVATVREAHKDRTETDFWTVEEILKAHPLK